MIQSQDLCFAAPFGLESMLTVIQNVVLFQMFDSLRDDDVFKQFTTQGRE